MQKIFIFGDSIAYGAWDPEGGWVERLRQWLFVTTRDNYNLGTFLYNLSIVGDTTADLLRRFPTEIAARQHGYSSCLPPGINDAQSVNGRPMATPADVCTNVRALMRGARAWGHPWGRGHQDGTSAPYTGYEVDPSHTPRKGTCHDTAIPEHHRASTAGPRGSVTDAGVEGGTAYRWSTPPARPAVG